MTAPATPRPLVPLPLIPIDGLATDADLLCVDGSCAIPDPERAAPLDDLGAPQAREEAKVDVSGPARSTP